MAGSEWKYWLSLGCVVSYTCISMNSPFSGFGGVGYVGVSPDKPAHKYNEKQRCQKTPFILFLSFYLLNCIIHLSVG